LRPIRSICLSALLLCACASDGSAPPPAESDPIQPVNRVTFAFNDTLDVLIFEPLAVGWEFITFEALRVHIDQALKNLAFPVRLFGNLMQAELAQSGEETARFLINSTVGLAGFFDPAAGWGLEPHPEDFGQALGRWGVPPGPYLVLPILGPSSPRDALGRIVDTALGSGPALLSPAAGIAVRSTELVNTRALVLHDVRDLKAASLDYYVAVRNAHIQIRQAQVRNQEAGAEELDDDLYEIDEDEE